MLKSVKVQPGYNEYTPDKEAIEFFFDHIGSAKSAEETLWDMFQSSISNPDDTTEYVQNASRSFLYRRLVELLNAIEPPVNPRHTKFNEN